MAIWVLYYIVFFQRRHSLLYGNSNWVVLLCLAPIKDKKYNSPICNQDKIPKKSISN
jgi:hypothetical protein